MSATVREPIGAFVAAMVMFEATSAFFFGFRRDPSGPGSVAKQGVPTARGSVPISTKKCGGSVPKAWEQGVVRNGGSYTKRTVFSDQGGESGQVWEQG